tara:strand:+ start:107 stop:610 length:504 start_codon:yes stop_codon:yes gene_type:complete
VTDTKDTSWSKDKLFSSAKQDWATPWSLFNVLNDEFGFALDAAASSDNAKCATYLTEDDDALNVSWSELVGNKPIWLNPPYGREIGKWIKKACLESRKGSTVVCLTFCRSDTQWWHNWAMKSAEIRLIPGRITFEGATSSAPAPSCLLIFDEDRRMPLFTTQALPRK